MGDFDPGYSRLAIIIVIFIALSCLYTFEAVFLENKEEKQLAFEKPIVIDNMNPDYFNESNLEENTRSEAPNYFYFINFMTFTTPNVPDWMKVILSPISTILLIIQGYLIADFLYDIIKALPFT